MKVLLYEDDKHDREILKTRINNFLSEHKYKYELDECVSSKMLLDQACVYDFLFMDIELGSENGIDLGLKIRKKHKNCHIIITSNYTKYLIDGYKVKADRYLLKPISQELFDSEMAPVFLEYYAENTTIYDEKISRYRIRLNDIVYIDFFDKNSYLVFDNGKKLKTPYPLYYWEEKLSKEYFARCYKSILVNLNYVDTIVKNDIILVNKQKVPVSRFYRKQFEEKWLENIQRML